MIQTERKTGKIFRLLLLLGLLLGMLAVPRIELYAAGTLSNGVGGSLNHDPRHSSYAADSPYGKAEYLYDTLTITGSGMKQGEKIYNVKDIENLYADQLFGCDVSYSVTGSEGAYKSWTLSGVRLYELLVQAGLDTSLPDSTEVTLMAKDGYNSLHTLGDIRNTAQYNFYNPAGESQAGNLPVMVAFASNGYPLVGPIGSQGWFDTGIAGLVEDGANSGGPLKITFGQTAPGSNNAQYNSKLLYKIIVGNDVKSSQHNRSPYSQYGEKQLLIKLIDAASSEVRSSQTYTVNQIETMVNGQKTALVRNYYPDTAGNYYEGIDLWYLLADQFGLSGNTGEFSFVDANGNESKHINLEYLRNPDKDYSAYYTSKDGLPISWVKPLLAYARNGEPLQDQGPLLAALPQHNNYLSQGFMQACTGMNIYIIQDACTHNTEPYSQWKNEPITFTGDGLNQTQEFKVGNLEQLLELIQDDGYTVGSETANYRGINLYRLLQSNKLGLKMATDRIDISSADGGVSSFTLEELQNSSLKVMLAYGKNHKPLVPSRQDQGYDKSAANSGGPLFLVVNGDAKRCVEHVNKVTVTAKKTESWKHDRQAPYNSYLDTNYLRICGSAIQEPEVYSLRELEAMEAGIVREYLSASEVKGYYEGLDLKYLLQAAGSTSQPARINVCSPDASGAVFAKELVVDEVWSGISSTTQNGAIKPVVLAYAKDGYPLVNSFETEAGYVATVDNGFGPLRLVVENSKPLCVKYVAGIIVGDGIPVAYTVNYLDKASGKAISNPRISVGTDGENIAAAADKVNITGYVFNCADKDKLSLSASDKASNVVNLYYDKQAEPGNTLVDIGLVISGSGIPKIMYFTRDELQQIATGTHPTLSRELKSYSALARGGLKTLIRAQGIGLGTLLQKTGIGKDSYVIKTISNDGNRVDLNYNGTTGKFDPQRYYYADILPGDNGASGPVDPILAMYRAESNEEDSNPHLPTQEELKQVGEYPLPTLTVGQTNQGDYNNQFNNKYVQQLIIGDKYAAVFSISGKGLAQKLSYNLPDLLLKGMEKCTRQGKACEGISLARLLSDIKGLEDTAQASFVTGSQGGVTVYQEDKRIEHVSELVIGSSADQSLQMSELKNPDKKYFLAYNVTDKTVNPVGPGGGLIPRPIEIIQPQQSEQKPADLPVLPDKPCLNMEPYTQATSDSDGKTKIILKAEARQAIQEAKSSSVLLFNSSRNARAVTLEISGEMLARLQDKDMYLQIDFAQGNFFIQADALDISGFTDKWGSKNLVLQIKVNAASAQQTQALQASLAKNYSLQSIPQSTEILCGAGEKPIKISEFTSYICRDLLLSSQLIPAQSTVLCWDEGSNTPRVVPTVFVERAGQTYARAYSRSNSLYAVVSGSTTFADIQKSPAQKDIELLASKLIMSGKSSREFDPNGSVTRAELAAMLVRALGLKEQAGKASCFSDIKGTEWFAGYIAAATQAKIINGMPDGSFKPQLNVSRQEATVMLANALQLAGVKTELGTKEKAMLVSRFSDHQNIAAWAYPAVAVTVQAGIIKGEGDFAAGHKSNRAEAASMVAGLLRAAAFIDERSDVLKVKTAPITAPPKPSSNPNSREDEKGTIVVDGPVLTQKKVFTLDDLKAMTDITVNESYFSRGKAKPGWAAEQSDTFTGVSVYKLLMNKIGFKNYPGRIEVTASDGFYKVFTLDEFTGLYMDEKNPAVRLEMIIAWAQNGKEFKVQSEQPFRIIFGQKYEGDFNRQNWVNNVKKIMVY